VSSSFVLESRFSKLRVVDIHTGAMRETYRLGLGKVSEVLQTLAKNGEGAKLKIKITAAVIQEMHGLESQFAN
jgi:hypothetical protein